MEGGGGGRKGEPGSGASAAATMQLGELCGMTSHLEPG